MCIRNERFGTLPLSVQSSTGRKSLNLDKVTSIMNDDQTGHIFNREDTDEGVML